MASREDVLLSQKETFTHDGLDRLTHWEVSNSSGTRKNYVEYDYDTGNITYKSDLGVSMAYGDKEGSRPHALASLDKTPPGYELPLTIRYNSNNKVLTLGSSVRERHEFAYGGDKQRMEMLTNLPGGSGTTRKYYMGNFEEFIDTQGRSHGSVHYIPAPDGLASVYRRDFDGGRFYHAYTDHLGSLTALVRSDGTVMERYAYDPWGVRRDPKNWHNRKEPTLPFIERGFTMHEHLGVYGNFINMNGRMYDPDLGQFFSPDPYLQDPSNWLNFNRYYYCFNNPLMYTDPDGEIAWFAPILFASAAFAVGNTAAHAMRGDIHNIGDGLKYFGQGALTGAALGAAWQFAPAVLPFGQSVQNVMSVYATGQLAWGGIGMVGGGITDGWKGVNNGLRIFTGNFYLDENSFFGGIKNGISRHTWESLQTFVGHGYTQIRNSTGGVDRVDFLGGATFATAENMRIENGVSIGNFININNHEKISGNFENYVLSDDLYMHEYGHTIDSRRHGFGYLPFVGFPSLISADKSNKTDHSHSHYWTERRGNKYASSYFWKYYKVEWDNITRPFW